MSKTKKYLCGLIILALLCPQHILAQDQMNFSEREEYYKTYCNVDLNEMSQNDQDVCTSFKKFLEHKLENNQLEINKKQEEATVLKIQVDEIMPKIAELNSKKENQSAQIESLTKITDGIDAEIYAITKQIIVVNEKIAAYENEKKTLLPLSAHNKDNMKRYIELNNLIKIETEKGLELADKREKKGKSFQEFDEIIQQIEREKAELKKTEDELAPIILEFKEKESEIMSLMNTFIDDSEETKRILDNISEKLSELTLSTAFISPLKSGTYSKSAGTWFYPSSFGGGLHLGVDYAASIGTEVVAPASGVILYTSNACTDNGYVGNSCGYPGTPLGGNQVHMIVDMNGTLFAISFSHLRNNSIIVNTGDIVKQGDIIGEIGLSGNTSGAHTHVQMYNLGNQDLNDFIKSWNSDLSFGTGYGSTGYNNRCSQDKQANCRVQPENYLPY